MLSISILTGILNEYGSEEFLKRLNKILNTNLKLEKNAKIIAINDAIIIGNTNPITITIEDELYKLTTEFPTYKAIKYYYNGELFRNLIAFNTKDNQLLTLDHLDNGNFNATRISKTTEEDKYYNQGYYEREITTFPDIPININSHYQKSDTKEEEERVVDLAGENLYYHHYQGDTNTEYYEESSICIDRPFVKATGHIRIPDDLMLTSFERNRANIIIRGISLDSDNNPAYFYQTIFEFFGTTILITDTIVDYDTKEINTNKTKAKTNRYNFNSDMLGALINSAPQIIESTHVDSIIKELSRIMDVLLVKEGKKAPEIHQIDLMMNVITDPNYLALNIYENQEQYEDIINNDLNIVKTSILK